MEDFLSLETADKLHNFEKRINEVIKENNELKKENKRLRRINNKRFSLYLEYKEKYEKLLNKEV